MSHSSKDTRLIRLIELAFANREIEPYFAKSRMEGKNPVEKIVEAIGKSIGLFALITPTVVEDPYTRDWVVFEIGIAKAKDVPIFCWMDKSVAAAKSYPKLLDNITDYDNFSCQEVDDCIRVADSVRDKAFGLGGLRRKSGDFSDEQLKTGLNQIEKAHAIAEKSLTRTVAPSEKETVQPSKLLPDNRKIADLNIDNSFLNQIYETARRLAKDRYDDAQLSSFCISVFPFIIFGSRVSIYLGFCSAQAGRTCTYMISDLYPQVKHSPPDKEIRHDIDKKVLKNLPWKESPDWKQFLQISIANIGPLSPDDMTRYVITASPWGIADLGKTDVFWNVMLVDNFSGKEYMFRWNGQKVDAHNIKRDY